MDPVMSPEAVAALRDKAADAARLLALLGNENRLVLLCHLVQAGEMGVGALAEAVGLSQPALSQHLARLREDGLVATRRKAQTVHYRLADPRVAAVMLLLRDLFCSLPGDTTPSRTNAC
ncbi:ArsR/SmtB family transcription factor [Neoroseomonas alba]|nr:metalloregulator ArsR/SmtB family transcription factor [Neoroseomonas alba]